MSLAPVNFKLNLYLGKPVFGLIALQEIHFNSAKNALFLDDQNVQSSLEKYLLGFFWLK